MEEAAQRLNCPPARFRIFLPRRGPGPSAQHPHWIPPILREPPPRTAVRRCTPDETLSTSPGYSATKTFCFLDTISFWSNDTLHCVPASSTNQTRAIFGCSWNERLC